MHCDTERPTRTGRTTAKRASSWIGRAIWHTNRERNDILINERDELCVDESTLSTRYTDRTSHTAMSGGGRRDVSPGTPPLNDTSTARNQKSINFRLHALDSSLFRSAKQYYGVKFGLGVPEMRILSNLDSEGPLAANQIVALTVMDKALVSRILTALHKRGSIEPTPASSAKRPVWTLSKAGGELVDRLRPLWRQREAMVQAVLTPDEQATLKEMLERLFVASETLRIEEARALQQQPQRLPPKSKTRAPRPAGPRNVGTTGTRNETER